VFVFLILTYGVFNTSWYLLLSLLSSINESNLVSFTIIIRELNRVRQV